MCRRSRIVNLVDKFRSNFLEHKCPYCKETFSSKTWDRATYEKKMSEKKSYSADLFSITLSPSFTSIQNKVINSEHICPSCNKDAYMSEEGNLYTKIEALLCLGI